MRTLLSLAALFLSILLVQLGSGSLGPLDALAGAARGFTPTEIGILGSAHFAGFLVGCVAMPRILGQVGHARAFAFAAAVGAVGPLLHPVLEGPMLWAGLRVLTGFAIAAAYTTVESWLHAKATNANRGRIYSSFRVVDLIGQVMAQGMIAVLDPATYAAYNIVGVFCCLCLIPLALTTSLPPQVSGDTRLRPIVALRAAPTACMGIVVAGVSGSALRMVGPVYGLEIGLDQAQIALFLTAAIVGGVASQIPVGWFADAYDRRLTLIGLSVLAAGSCVATALFVPPGYAWAAYLAAFAFGATSFPVYSVSAAFANDYATRETMVEVNAALIFFFSIGAIVAPFLSARLMALGGPAALFVMVAAAHAMLIAFTLYRMTRRRAPGRRTPYSYLPRTSMLTSLYRKERTER